MTLRIWLHEGHDGEAGVEAHGLDFLGFSTWAETRTDVLAKLPARFAEYGVWRARHGLPIDADPARVEIVDHLVGNEILFAPDREPSRPAEIDLTIRLLACSRADLLGHVGTGPEGAIDWDPPYERFASWADWRTIRANLAHVANAETHYYTRNIGREVLSAPADPKGDWKAFLPQSRADTVAFLEALGSSQDLCRVRTIDFGHGQEEWSVRKALRRMVSHELVHSKSIRRILRDYRRLSAGS